MAFSRLRGNFSAVTALCLSPNCQNVITGSSDGSIAISDASTGKRMMLLEGHDSPVISMSIAADGIHLVSTSKQSAILWDIENGSQLVSFEGHEDEITSVAISQDSSIVVTGSKDNNAIVWSTESGEQLVVLQGHTAAVTSTNCSRDGFRVVTGSADHSTIVWDARTGSILATLKLGHVDSVQSVCFTGDGSKVVTGSLDKTCIVWDIQLGKHIRVFKGHTGPVTSVCVSSDGYLLVTSSVDGTAIVWDFASGKSLRTLKGHSDSVTSACITSNAATIATGSQDKTIRLWNASTGDCTLTTRPHPGSLTSVCTCDRYIVTAGYDKSAVLWDAQRFAINRVFTGHTDRVTSVSLSREGSRLVTGGRDKVAIVWDTATGARISTLGTPGTNDDGEEPSESISGHSDEITSVCMSSDGTQVVTGGFDAKAFLWDVASGKIVMQFLGHTEAVKSVHFVSELSRIATGSNDRTAKIWDSKTGQTLLTVSGHAVTVSAAQLSQDGTILACSSGDHSVIIWDTRSGDKIRILGGSSSGGGGGVDNVGHSDVIMSLCMSWDSQRLVTCSADHSALLWDVTTGRCIRSLSEHADVVSSVCMSPDGSRIVTGSLDCSAVVWLTESAVTSKMLPEGHSNLVRCVAFSRDSSMIATGGGDDVAILWNINTATKKCVLHGHSGWVTGIGFTPDGLGLVTCSGDATTIVWDLPSESQRLVLRGHSNWISSLAVSDNAAPSTIPTSNIANGISAGINNGSFKIVTASFDRSVIVWNGINGMQLKLLKPPAPGPGPVGTGIALTSVALSRDESLVVAGGEDAAVFVWNLDSADSTPIRTIRGMGSAVTSVCLNWNGSQLLIGCYDKTASLWDMLSGERVQMFRGHTDRVNSVSFSRNGGRVLTASDDNTATIWDIKSGESIRVLRGHTAGLSCAQYSGDQLHIVTCCDDGSAMIHSNVSIPHREYFSNTEELCRLFEESLEKYRNTGTVPWSWFLKPEIREFLLLDDPQGFNILHEAIIKKDADAFVNLLLRVSPHTALTARMGRNGQRLPLLQRALQCHQPIAKNVKVILKSYLSILTLSENSFDEDHAIANDLGSKDMCSHHEMDIYLGPERLPFKGNDCSEFVKLAPHLSDFVDIRDIIECSGPFPELFFSFVRQLTVVPNYMFSEEKTTCKLEHREYILRGAEKRRAKNFWDKECSVITATEKQSEKPKVIQIEKQSNNQEIENSSPGTERVASYTDEYNLYEVYQDESAKQSTSNQGKKCISCGTNVISNIKGHINVIISGLTSALRDFLYFDNSVPVAVSSHLIPLKNITNPDFLKAIVDCSERMNNKQAFANEVVQMLIEYKWETCIVSYFLWDFFLLGLLFTVFLVNAVLYTDYVRSDDAAFRGIGVALLTVIVLLTGHFLMHEVVQYRKHGFRSYVSEGWNLANLITNSFVVATTVIQIVCWAQDPHGINDNNSIAGIIGAVAIPLLGIQSLFYLGGLRSTGALVRMIIKITRGVGTFTLILLVVLISFAGSFVLLFQEQSGLDLEYDGYTRYDRSLLTVYGFLFGSYSIYELSQANSPALAFLLLTVFLFFVVIVLLNLLIALMGDLYDEVQDNATAETNYGLAKLILEYEELIPKRIKAKHHKKWYPTYLQVLRKDTVDESQPNEVSWMGRLKAIRDVNMKLANSVKHDVKSDMKKVKSEVNSIKSDISKISGEMATLKNDVKKDMTKLSQDVNDIKSAIMRVLEMQHR